MCVIYVFYDTIASIVSIWYRSETFAHGFIIVPISIYMIWLRREFLKQATIKPSILGLLFMLPVMFLLLLGTAGNILVLEQLMFYLLIPLMVLTLYGWQAAWIIAFPLAYLIFAVPFGDELVPVLQDITAVFAIKSLQITGIPVYAEGRFISIPTGNFEVAQACSGIRYIFASLALGSFYAYITFSSLLKRSIFILVSLIVPIIANGLRAYGIIILAYLSDNEIATGFDHIIYGWIFFGVIMFLLFWIGNYWREPIRMTPEINMSQQGETRRMGRAYIIPVLMLLVIAIYPATQYWLSYKSTHVSEINTVDNTLPAAVNNWTKSTEFKQDWRPVFRGADASLYNTYVSDGFRIHVIKFIYNSQTQEKELINHHNRIFDIGKETGWRLLSEKLVKVNSEPVVQEILRNRQQRLLAWYWYDIGGYSVANKFKAKLMDAYARLLSNEPSSITVLAIDTENDPRLARQTLKSFFIDYMNNYK